MHWLWGECQALAGDLLQSAIGYFHDPLPFPARIIETIGVFVLLSALCFWREHKQRATIKLHRDHLDYVKLYQAAARAGQPAPVPSKRLKSGIPPIRQVGGNARAYSPRDIDGSFTDNKVKVAMDVYTTMQRQLEHYRQLGVSVMFGILGFYTFVDSALLKEAPAVGRPLKDGLLMAALLLAGTAFGHFLLWMVKKSFMEATFVIQRIELASGLFDPDVIGSDCPAILPENWPTGDRGRDETELRHGTWRDDLVPVYAFIVLALGCVNLTYIFYNYVESWHSFFNNWVMAPIAHLIKTG